QTRRRSESEGERGRDTPALVLHDVALWNVRIVIEEVQAKCAVAIEGVIDVGSRAAVSVRSDAERAANLIFQVRRLADLVDGAAARAAPADRTGRAFCDLHAVEIERIARIASRIADPIDEYAVTRGETAHAEVLIARQAAAAFAGL